MRTAFIFTCGLAILVLRIANYHVGLRTTASGFQTLHASLSTLRTYETGLWYLVSSLIFCHVFLWSAPEHANLGWVTFFSGDRAKLNEAPLFLMSYLMSCAVWKTFQHYGSDVDRLILGLSGNKNDKSANPGDSLKVVLKELHHIGLYSATAAASSLLLAFPLYLIFLRPFIWGWSLVFLRPFYSLPKSNMLPPHWPFNIYVLFRCLQAGALIHFVWNTGNFAFSTFMVKEPLKNGNPLTSESKDPNGSILNGLKSKKLPIKVSRSLACI